MNVTWNDDEPTMRPANLGGRVTDGRARFAEKMRTGRIQEPPDTWPERMPRADRIFWGLVVIATIGGIAWAFVVTV